MPAHVNSSQVLLFADDLKIFKEIKNNYDCYLLQKDINSIVYWSQNNELQFNVSKCKIMTFSLKMNCILTNYSINNETLKRVQNCKDLGVIFNSHLKWDDHVDNIVSSSLKNLGFLIRNTMEFNNINTIKLLYNSLVRSKLEFANKVWNPSTNLHQQKIETVQNKYLKYLYYKMYNRYPRYDEYHNIRREINIFKLSERREISAVLFMHKLINNRMDCPKLLPLVKLYTPAFRCRPRDVFYIPFCRTNIRMNSAFIKILSATNSIINEPNINIFDTPVCNFREQIYQIYNKKYN